MLRTIALATGFLLASGLFCPARADNQPAAQEHVDRARALAGEEFASSLFLCDPAGGKTIYSAALNGSDHWLPPTRLFDDFYYVGNEFVGVFVLRTSAGLILFDSMTSTANARDHLVPGLRALGLDPATIRYVVVTHAHWDHYGGAQYLHDTFGPRVALSAEDWDMFPSLAPGSLERAPTFGADRNDRPPPTKDFVIHDGDKLTLGDKTVTLLVTPGHTPGTLSALIPVSEGGKPYILSLLGGTAFPRKLEPADHMGGLTAFSVSIERLSRASQAARAIGVINTHIFVDGSLQRINAAAHRQPGQPNPFLLGTDAVTRYYGMFDECLKAAAARPPQQFDMKKLLQGTD